MNPLAMMNLFNKYGGFTADQVSAPLIVEIGEAAGFKFDPAKIDLPRIVNHLKMNDINALADMASKPEVLREIFAFIHKDHPVTMEIVRECHHCGQLNIYEVNLT